jgi:hypothetical protein
MNAREPAAPGGDPDAAGSSAGECHDFDYRGWRFTYSARRMASGIYRPVVVCLGQGPGHREQALPDDTDEIGYASEAEALRHAEQQAVRWVHDRTGDGQGQF